MPPPEEKKKAVTSAYVPTPKEREAVGAFLAKRKEKTPSPSIKITKKNGVPDISNNHPEPRLGATLLMETFATTDTDFYRGLISQLFLVGPQGLAAKKPKVRLARQKGAAAPAADVFTSVDDPDYKTLLAQLNSPKR